MGDGPREPDEAGYEALLLDGHDLLDEGVVIGDQQRLLRVNDTACRLLGRDRADVLALPSLLEAIVPAERDRIEQLIASKADAGEVAPGRYETVVLRPDGSTLDVELAVSAVVTPSWTRTLVLVRDISERLRTAEELYRMAREDSLTGLANRRSLTDSLRHLLARAQRNPVQAGMLLADIDGFKAVNDSMGHAAGDRALEVIGGRLRRQLRECDVAARLGGDEFVVLCEDIDGHGVDGLKARVEQLVSEPIELEAGTATLGVSVGAHLFGTTTPLPDADAILASADRAMYAAKARRREEQSS